MSGRLRGRQTRPLTPFGRGVAATCLGLAVWLSRSVAAEPMDAGLEFYRARIEPVLVAHCYECHSARAETPEGGLRVDRPDLLRAGGDSGRAVVPGQAAASLLLQAIRHDNGLEMPPDKPRLPDTVLRDFEQWISSGAPLPPAPVSEVLSRHDPRGAHWAFQPIRRPAIPAVRAAEWIASPVDAFVLQQLEQRGFQPAPDAERWVWLRRVYFDL
ncbi:MAG: c-type cytochrome domain-containing protein, partial [Pirellulaceae bacterium]